MKPMGATYNVGNPIGTPLTATFYLTPGDMHTIKYVLMHGV
jgi:hypothetical protein